MIAKRPGVVVPGLTFLVAAAAYAALGLAVAHTAPAGIDAAARAVTGEAPRIAWIFTESCLWPVLTAFGVIGVARAVALPAWRGRIVFALVTTLVAWQTSNVLKDLFRRPRPEYWIVHRETTFAYSSGHAMFAVLIYWLWAYHATQSELPAGVRVTLAGLLVAWGGGVLWSRLALGAHYPSDLAGGLLLAVAMLALGTAISVFVAPDIRIV